MPNKQELLEFQGTVIQVLPDTKFKVKLHKNNAIITTHISGKMRTNHIRVVIGDEVIIEMTPYDLTKGRIIKRIKASEVVETN